MDNINEHNLLSLKADLSKHSSVLGIILCGSANTSESSILNIFIIVDKSESVDLIKSLIDSMKYSSLNYTIKSIEDMNKIENVLLQDIFKSGKMIYWSGKADLSASQIFKIKPYTLFTFELSGMAHNLKAQFNYKLYGKKDNGQLKEWSGARLTKSCFYVPHANKFKVTRFLSKFDINSKNIDIWL